MATLTRQRVIMHQRVTDCPDRVLFRENLDEPGVARGITFSLVDFADMGSPTVITVTVEPGDLLCGHLLPGDGRVPVLRRQEADASRLTGQLRRS